MSANLRLVMKMTMVGRVGPRIDVMRELYLLSLDTAKERGVCPDAANDNAGPGS